MRRILLGGALAVIACFAACQPSADEAFRHGLDAYREGDYEKARETWLPIAEAGHGVAQRNLGVLYFLGQGVEQDHAAALQWFRRAAEQGTAESALKLAVMYVNGQGLERDLVAAYQWARIAKDQGDPAADEWLASLPRLMTAEQITEARSLADAWQPAR